MNQSINGWGDCRTAPDTLGLLNIKTEGPWKKSSPGWYSGIKKFCVGKNIFFGPQFCSEKFPKNKMEHNASSYFNTRHNVII